MGPRLLPNVRRNPLGLAALQRHAGTVDQPRTIDSGPVTAALPVRFVLAASAIVLTAYTLTLMVALDDGFWHSLAGGVANTIPPVLFGLVAYRLIVRHLVGRPVLRQLAGHVLIGAAFVLLAYWLLLVLIGVAGGASPVQFDVRPFINRAAAWQTLQNVTTYGVIAAIAYARGRPAEVKLVLHEAGAAETPLSRYFIRNGDDILPIDVDAIVSISGADDYAEVATLQGRHLIRMTLAELEQSLDPARFIRVHRSRIVNLDRIARAEPAGGGRMLLHMEDGEAIPASRAGAKLLRERML